MSPAVSKKRAVSQQAAGDTPNRLSRVLQRNDHRNWWWAALVFAGIAGIVEAGVWLYKGAAAADAYTAAVDTASELRARAESDLNALIYLNSGLSAYVRVNAGELDEGELREMLAEMFRTTRHTQNFGLARGYILTLVYPEAGNRGAIGLDYRTRPDQLGDVQAAIDARKPMLSHRVNLAQGGQGVIYRAPIFVDGDYWGMLSTVIDINSLLRAAFAVTGLSQEAFAVREIDGSTLWGDARLFATPDNPRLVGDHGWEYVVAPIPDSQDLAVVIAFRVLGYVLAVLLAAVLLAVLEHRVSLIRLSNEDGLTGLANRRVLDERIALRLRALDRDPSAGFALVFIDLDQFKPINDTYGHRGGDAVLAEIGDRLRDAVRGTDLAARWGGDEFAVFAPETRISHLSVLVNRIRAIFDEPVTFEGDEIPIAGSIGYAIAPNDGDSEAELVAAADERMYSAKTASRRQ